MIGIYDYTVVLTYLSLLSASIGIVVSLGGTGHPYIGCFFLLLCGLCDAFDGKVARTKQNRSELERNFGIQIDSLSDLVAFGVLPTCIGAALIRTSAFLQNDFHGALGEGQSMAARLVLYAVLVLYPLAALIRLAYFNVTEEERQRKEGGTRRYFTGLPVTSAALIFPMVLMLHYILKADLTLVYIVVALITGFLFVSRIKVPKPGFRGVMIAVAVGSLEFAIMLVWWFLRRGA